MVENNRKCVSVNKKGRKFDANLDMLGWIVVILAIILIVFGIIFLITSVDYLIMAIILIVAGAITLMISFSILKCRTGESKN